jgi:FkbM family methyltransferase
LRLYNLLKPADGRRALRTRTRYGSQFLLTPWDEIDIHVLMEGFYESEVLEAVRPSLGPGAVLWVVGANFGLHAITAKFLHPEATVVAFEPSATMGALLIENSELNDVRIDLHAYALSDVTGAMPFFANASGNPGMSTLHPVNSENYDRKFVVATLTADDVIARGITPPPTAMILDAEGAECAVLRGFGAGIAKDSFRVLVFEASNDFLEAKDPAFLHSSLTNAGFSLKKLERFERTAHNLSNFVASRK